MGGKEIKEEGEWWGKEIKEEKGNLDSISVLLQLPFTFFSS